MCKLQAAGKTHEHKDLLTKMLDQFHQCQSFKSFTNFHSLVRRTLTNLANLTTGFF